MTKKVFYEALDDGDTHFNTVNSLSLYQNYLAFSVNSYIKLIDLEKEKVVFKRKLKLEPGAVNKEVSFDRGNLFWSEEAGNKLFFTLIIQIQVKRRNFLYQ